MKVYIGTPERTLLDSASVKSLNIPASEGDMTVLPGHDLYMGTLGTGGIQITLEDNSISDIFVSGGVAQVINNDVIILATSAEHASELDEAAIREEIRLSEERAKSIREDVELADIEAHIAKSLAKLKLTSKILKKT